MSDLSRLPLNSLRAVEVLGRRGTLAAAAEELGITTGAVSQRLLEAERRLGLPLFSRTPRGMVPTEAGARVLPHLAEGFRQLATALARARPAAEDRLVLSVAPVFAARWLIWRLPDFQAAHPDLRVRLEARLARADLAREGIDLAIRVGPEPGPGVTAERLFGQLVFPVCAPALAERLRRPADLAQVPVIREPHPGFAWDDWLAPEGAAGQALGEGPDYSDAALCLDAAISGQGVFLAFETLAADALERGALVRPFGGRHATANSYWLCRPEGLAPTRAAMAFARWLRGQVERLGRA